MASILKDLVRQYEEAKPYADPRTRNWLLVENSPWPVWTLTVLYLLFVFIGPRFMKNRAPLDLKWFLVIYNLGLVGLSLYMFVELLLSVLNAKYDMICADYNKDSWTKPEELRDGVSAHLQTIPAAPCPSNPSQEGDSQLMPQSPRMTLMCWRGPKVASVLWWYFFSKAIEFMDTVLMIVRKKNEQVTFLHVFHHVTMLLIWWWTLMFAPGGMSWFGAWMNCLVHVVMYTYYGLSAVPAFKGRLWWKRYLTRFQLLQFCITFTHTVNSIRVGCDFPRWGQNLLASYMVVMLILFGNFYIHAYIKRRSGKLKNGNGKGIANGSHVTNGSAHGVTADGIRTKAE